MCSFRSPPWSKSIARSSPWMPERAWKAVRDLDLAQSTLVRTLFAIRTIPDRLKGKATVSCVSAWTTWCPHRPSLVFRCLVKTLRTNSRLARSAKCGGRSFRSSTLRMRRPSPRFRRRVTSKSRGRCAWFLKAIGRRASNSSYASLRRMSTPGRSSSATFD